MNKLNNIKIVFLDIDGTLTTSKKRVTLKTRKAIKRLKDKGTIIVLVTGRDLSYTINISRKALASPIVISSNGSEIYDYSKSEIINGSYIPYLKLEKLFDFCNDNKIRILFNGIKEVYANKYMIGYKRKRYKIITNLKELEDLNIIQCTFQIDKQEDIDKCKKIIDDLDLKINYLPKGFEEKKLNSIDINNEEVSKGKAVSNLLKELNIKKEESLCIGDYINDKSMFDACGYKVAMNNGVKELKDMADFITLSNDKNGVADFINKYL